MTYQLERQAYVPMGVFKCLVKMALAIMPASEASRCAHLRDWILQPHHTLESSPCTPLVAMAQLIPGPMLHDQISYALLKRRAGVNCPYMIFVIQFSSCVFQVSVPMPTEDQLDAGEERSFDVMYYPTVWENKHHITTYGRPQFSVQDLSACEVARGELATVKLRYDTASGQNLCRPA